LPKVPCGRGAGSIQPGKEEQSKAAKRFLEAFGSAANASAEENENRQNGRCKECAKRQKRLNSTQTHTQH